MVLNDFNWRLIRIILLYVIIWLLGRLLVHYLHILVMIYILNEWSRLLLLLLVTNVIWKMICWLRPDLWISLRWLFSAWFYDSSLGFTFEALLYRRSTQFLILFRATLKIWQLALIVNQINIWLFMVNNKTNLSFFDTISWYRRFSLLNLLSTNLILLNHILAGHTKFITSRVINGSVLTIILVIKLNIVINDINVYITLQLGITIDINI